MGGKNHRPTKGLAITTALSAQCAWAIGQGITHLWQANSELEKAIIAATGATDATRFVQPTGDSVAHLENSISFLQTAIHDIHNIIESYDDLLKKCVELEYKGNPLASQLINGT